MLVLIDRVELLVSLILKVIRELLGISPIYRIKLKRGIILENANIEVS
jgi:hypothetical protein